LGYRFPIKPSLSLTIIATLLFSVNSCVSPDLRQLDRDFELMPEAWKIHPRGSISIVEKGKVLNVEMSAREKVNLWKSIRLAQDTEIVKISFRVRFQTTSRGWTKSEPPSYRLNLQEPATYGTYNSGEYLVSLSGGWETHEVVQMYKTRRPGPESLRLRALPEELVINIQVDEGSGTFQFDDFRVQELVTKLNVDHR
jgi:hypothetical protein